MMWGKCQRDCIQTTGKTKVIYKSRGIHKTFNKNVSGFASYKERFTCVTYKIMATGLRLAKLLRYCVFHLLSN